MSSSARVPDHATIVAVAASSVVVASSVAVASTSTVVASSIAVASTSSVVVAAAAAAAEERLASERDVVARPSRTSTVVAISTVAAAATSTVVAVAAVAATTSVVVVTLTVVERRDADALIVASSVVAFVGWAAADSTGGGDLIGASLVGGLRAGVAAALELALAGIDRVHVADVDLRLCGHLLPCCGAVASTSLLSARSYTILDGDPEGLERRLCLRALLPLNCLLGQASGPCARISGLPGQVSTLLGGRSPGGPPRG